MTRVLGSGLLLGLLAVCGGSVGGCSEHPRDTNNDVVEDFFPNSDGCTGLQCFDSSRPLPDGSLDDGGADADATDDADPTDARGDAPELDGPCAPSGAANPLLNEPRVLSRPVYVESIGTGFAAGYQKLLGGSGNAFLARYASNGSSLGNANVSALSGMTVGSGAVAADGSGGYVLAYDVAASGTADAYLQRASATGAMSGTPLRLTNGSATASDERVLAVAGGWLVVWRSRAGASTTGPSSLMSASVSLDMFTATTPVPLPLGSINPGAFDVVANDGRAVVLVANQGGTRDLYSLTLTPSGAANGSPVQLTAGAGITGPVAAALRDADLVAVWTQPSARAALHARHVDVTSGAAQAVVDLAVAGTDALAPGLATDGATGYVLAWRAPSAMGGSAAMVRLDGSLAPVEAPSRVGSAAATGEAVRVAAGSDGHTYLVGWTDATGGTVGATQAMHCP